MVFGGIQKDSPFPKEVHIRQWYPASKDCGQGQMQGFLDWTLAIINHESSLHLLRTLAFSIYIGCLTKAILMPWGRGIAYRAQISLPQGISIALVKQPIYIEKASVLRR